MVAGEFASMTALHNAIPDASPAPIAFGTYATVPDAHFYLCTFVDMDNEVPDVHTFTAKVAELHTKGVSPTGKYGFPVPTYMGQMPQYTTWKTSWEAFFVNAMRSLMLVIEEMQGPDPELRALLETIIGKVVPPVTSTAGDRG